MRFLAFALVAVLLSGCASSGDGKKGRSDRRRFGPPAPSGIEDTTATPPHRLSRKDFPFDSSGKYRVDWATGNSNASSSTRRVAETKPEIKPSTSTTVQRYHIVKRGETLFALSRRYQVSLYALKTFNNLESYDSIREGKVLKIPKRSP